MLEKILQNKMLQATVFKQLKNLAKEYNIKHVMLTFDEKLENGFSADVHTVEGKFISRDDLNTLIKNIKE